MSHFIYQLDPLLQVYLWLVLVPGRVHDHFSWRNVESETISVENVRSNHLQLIFKIDVLKNFVISTGKHLCWSLFLIKLKALVWLLLLELWNHFLFFCLGLHNDRLKYCAQRRIQKLVRHLRLSFFFRKLVNEQKRQPSEVFCRKKWRHSGLQLYYKETPTQVFSCESAKFLRTFILKNIFKRLLLEQPFTIFAKKLHLRCFIVCTLPPLGDGEIEPFLRRFIGGTSVKLGYWVRTNFSHVYFGIFCLRIFGLFSCPLKLSKKYLLLFSNNSVKVQTLFNMCSE